MSNRGVCRAVTGLVGVCYRVWRIPFFWPNMNTEYYSVFRNHRIQNIEYYLVLRNPNTEYRILFGIKKIQIPNTNSTIWSNYSNTEYKIPNSIQNFGKKGNWNIDICPKKDILFWKYVKLFWQVFGVTIRIPVYYLGYICIINRHIHVSPFTFFLYPSEFFFTKWWS